MDESTQEKPYDYYHAVLKYLEDNNVVFTENEDDDEFVLLKFRFGDNNGIFKVSHWDVPGLPEPDLEQLRVETSNELLNKYMGFKQLRIVRNKLLNETDKYMISDYSLTPEQKTNIVTYRQQLRDLPENLPENFTPLTDKQGKITNVEFPVNPLK